MISFQLKNMQTLLIVIFGGSVLYCISSFQLTKRKEQDNVWFSKYRGGAFYYSAICMLINQPWYALNTSIVTIVSSQTQSGNRKNIAFQVN